MPTPFIAKASGEELYAAEVNAIYFAINKLEEAIGLVPGTSQAHIDPNQLADGIPASKISPTTDLAVRGLSASSQAQLLGGGVLDGSFSFGPQGALQVNGRLVIGQTSPGAPGILATDDTGQVTFRIDEAGNVTVRGRLYSDAESEFTGRITALSGTFAGSVTVGGDSGIIIDGPAKEIRLDSDGRIVAGGTVLSHAGIQIFQGSIDLGEGRFQVTEDGVLIARDATIFGTVTAVSGQIGGIHIEPSGIHIGGLGPDTSGFSLSSDGRLFAKQGSFTGEIHAQSGTLGDLAVTGVIQAGGTRITPSGIEIESGSINLGQGRFVVDGEGNLTATQANITGRITALSGSFQGPVQAGPHVVLDQEGIHVTGEAGIEVLGGNILVRRSDRTPLVEIGSYRQGFEEHRGIRVSDGTKDTFLVNEAGDVILRGTVYAESGEFTGTIHATAGEFGGVAVTGDVVVEQGGRILAGSTVIDEQGISLTSGRIDLAGRFIVTEDGTLTAEGARISGEITATSGRFAGDVKVGDEASQLIIQGSLGRIVAGGTILSSTGLHMTEGSIELGTSFSVTQDGRLTARDATIEGTIVVRSGEILGELTVGNGVRIIPGRIDVRGDEGIVLHGGSLVVYDTAEERLLAEIGTFSSPVVWPGKDMDAEIAVPVEGEEVGTGDGEETVFFLAENPVLPGSLTVYVDGAVAEGYSVDWSTGEITFAEPPEDGALITADYSWIPRHAGIRVSDGTRDTVVISRDGSVKIHGTIEAKDGYFGTPGNPYRITIDDRGIYSGELGAPDSPFGIYTSGPLAGSAYFRGTVSIAQESYIGDGIRTSELKILPGGRIVAGDPSGARVEIRGVGGGTGGFYAYDAQGNPTVQISAVDGSAVFRGAINATGGTILGNLTITTANSDIRIVGNPVGVTSIPGIYMFQTDGPGVIRLTSRGLQFSPNGGITWHDAVQFTGLSADAITDGTLRLHDTGTGANTRILVTKTQSNELVTLSGTESSKLTYDPLEPGSEIVRSLDGQTTYTRDEDYIIDYLGGRIQRTDLSSIPDGATVRISYTHHRVSIDSKDGITVHDGSIVVRSSQTGVTMISGGTINVGALNAGVYQSDNFISNGNFSQISSDWGVARTGDGASVPGFPAFQPGEPYYGDWIKDRMGRVYRYGAAYWIPDKSDTTYDEHGNLTGYARVSFAPQDFLHNIYGYAEIELGGTTYQWGQVEQDVYPFYNYSDGDFIIPNERFQDVVASVAFHWHSTHTAQNTVTLEVDELVPNPVFVEPKRTEPFTPVWDNVHEQYNGLTYSEGWEFVDDPDIGTGDNVAYGCAVSSNAPIVPGTENYAVDMHFVRESWATKTQGPGYHYLEVDLGSVQPINQIWVWHSMQADRRYRNNKLEVSADGEAWEVIYDSAVDGPWREGQAGKVHNFPTKQIRYIRDWIDGYEVLDDLGNPTGQVVEENQWLEIQARHCGYMMTSTPGAWVEWRFKTHSRADLWIGYLQASSHGEGYVEIDGVRVATIQQGVLIHHGGSDEGHEGAGVMHTGDDQHHTHSRAYVDVSSQANFQMVPRKEHVLRVVFADIPENYGKHFTLSRIKLEDFRLDGPHHTSKIIVASANVKTTQPYGFYTGYITPQQAKNYTGRGRQILKGMWDNPDNYSASSNCWIRYRIRVRSERAPGGNPNVHDHVMFSHCVMEYGTKPTSFRRSSLDLTPSHFLQEWDPRFPETTGVREMHLADGAVSGKKIKSGSIELVHLSPSLVIPESMLGLNHPSHKHDNKDILDQIQGWGSSGTSFLIARADHHHDGVYLKLTGGTVSGNLTVTGTINGIDLGQFKSAFDAHLADQSNPHNVTAAQVGALVSVKGIASPGGNVDIAGDAKITVTADTGSKRITIAHTGDHDDRYYTKDQLATAGQAEVHWDNLTSVPSEFNPPVASATVRGGVKVGKGLTIQNEILSVAFAGTGTADTVARSDHHHDPVYAKLAGATITGTYTFTATQDAIKLVPATNPNTQVNNEQVTLNDTLPSLLSQRPVHPGSETVTSLDGSVTYERDTDYEIDYWSGTIVRTENSSIPSGAQVKVSYLATKILFRITDPAQTDDKLAFDSEGNILANSITVFLTRSQEQTIGQTPGDFSILGNLTVSGSTTLGSTGTSVTSINGTLSVWSEQGGTKLFEVTTSGQVTVTGTLDAQALTVNGTPVALEGHDHDERYYTKASLQASGQAQVHWGNLTNVPATATRWPSWSEVTGKPSSFTPSAHASTHAEGGSDPITPQMIGAQPALGFTPVNKAGDTMSGMLTVPQLKVASGALALTISDNTINATSGGQPAVLNIASSEVRVGGYLVWHQGNHGEGSGLDADLLDGRDSSFYLNASNLNAGILPPERFDDITHGRRGGGDLHALATPTMAGFMSPEDKAKLDRISETGTGVPNQDAFSFIAVPGQNPIAASEETDTLTITAGTNIQLTTSAEDKRLTISAVHNHRQEHPALSVVVDRLGYGVISGLRVVAKNPPGMSVIVEPGLAHLPSGQRIELTVPVELTIDQADGQYARMDVIYISNTWETTPQANFGVERGVPSANPQEPPLPAGAIKLATVLVPALSIAVQPSQIQDKRQYVPVGYNQEEGFFQGRTSDRTTEAWRLDAQGRLRLAGGIATGGSANFVDVSAKAPSWEDAASKRHRHVYNEVPRKDASDASGRTYLLSYEPADDTLLDPQGVRINKAGKRIMLFRNGLLLRPHAPGDPQPYDYEIQNNRILFTEAPKPEDHILAFYEIYN